MDDIEDSGAIGELKNVSRAMLRDQTYASLKKAILTGRIAQGEKLNIRKLAAVSDFSSTPIREAFLKLEHDGIVVRAAGGHFFVRQFSQKEVERIFHLRILLETYGAAKTLEYITEEDISWLEENIRRSEEALAQDLISEVSELNAEFHNYLTKISTDGILQDLLQGLSDKIWIGRSTALYAPGKAENAITQHRKIVVCLKARNLRAVRRALKEHILTAMRIVSKEMARATEKRGHGRK
jgi:DNA-binding GntR family transcriptional regulator